MRKFYIFSLLILGSLGFTSCLDIFENIEVNKDGTGKYSLILTINEQFRKTMTESMESQANAMKQEMDMEDTEEIQGQDAEYKESLEKVIDQLQTVKGLKNIREIYNQTEFQFGYEFEFEDITALNNAMEATAGAYVPSIPGNLEIGKKKKVYEPSAKFIESNKNIIIRHQSAELGKVLDMKKSNGNNSGMMGGLDVAYLLQDMIFKTTFKFEQEIKASSNETAVIENSGKTLVLNCKPFAYKPADLNLLRQQELSCAQSLIIELK